MLTLKSLREAEKFVRRQKRLGADVRWEGWEIVFHRPADSAYFSKHGRFNSGQWGFENRVAVGSDGTWKVDYRDVRRPKRTGN